MTSIRNLMTAAAFAAACAAPVAANAAGALPALPLPQPLAAPAQPTAMPEFSFTDFRGNALKSSDLKGKVIVACFWASW